MIVPDVFRHVPVLVGVGVRLEPLTDVVLDEYIAAIRDPQVRRLTGSHTVHDRDTIRHWLATRGDHHDRADWAAVRAADDAFLARWCSTTSTRTTPWRTSASWWDRMRSTADTARP